MMELIGLINQYLNILFSVYYTEILHIWYHLGMVVSRNVLFLVLKN